MAHSRRPGRRGQGAVELALMIPFLFAVAFLIIEFAFYFGAIHYDTYAAFAAARALQTGGGSSASDVQSMLLTGSMTRNATINVQTDRATVTQPWEADLPFVDQVLPEMDFDVTVVLGPEEAQYEGQIVSSNLPDNNMH